MRNAPLLVAIAGAMVALLLAVTSLLQVPITKFPTEWEVVKVEQLLTSDQKAKLERSLGWIKSNNHHQLVVHFRLYRIAAYGFGALALLFAVIAYLLWSRARTFTALGRAA